MPMRVPFWLQGTVFVPLFIGFLFIIRAKILLPPVFLPVILFQSLFGGIGFVAEHEAVFVFIYWALVGALVGLCFDIFRRPHQAKTAPIESAVQGIVA